MCSAWKCRTRGAITFACKCHDTDHVPLKLAKSSQSRVSPIRITDRSVEHYLWILDAVIIHSVT